MRNELGWDWSAFRGSPEALKYNLRDLPSIARVLPRCGGRVAAVQAGGNLGIWPKALAREFETVYTFEPDGDTFAKLCHNAPEPNIIKLQAAAGWIRGTVEISRDRRRGTGPKHEGLGHVVARSEGAVPVIRIDDLALRRCDLLWLDVEGFELFALMGAEQTIERSHPVIVAEINHHVESYEMTAATVERWFSTKGYAEVDRFGSDRVYVRSGAQ